METRRRETCLGLIYGLVGRAEAGVQLAVPSTSWSGIEKRSRPDLWGVSRGGEKPILRNSRGTRFSVGA